MGFSSTSMESAAPGAALLDDGSAADAVVDEDTFASDAYIIIINI